MKPCSFQFRLFACLFFSSTLAAFGADTKKPVFLYTRNFNAPGEDRYSADTTYKQVIEKLGELFEVRVDANPITTKGLADVRVVLIANPSDKAVAGHPAPHHFSTQDINLLSAFVRRGGGLIVMANQENHNLDVEDTNKLLAQFGLQFTNRYTDAKKLVLPHDTPIIGSLRWAYYTGNQLQIDPGNAAHPRSLVTNDLNQKPAKGPRDEPGSLLAIAEPGRGRVVAVTDSGWIANFAFTEEGVGGVALKGQDNWEIFRRLALWSSHAD
jgi:hypothetical protein